jgi:hypothetical protein
VGHRAGYTGDAAFPPVEITDKVLLAIALKVRVGKDGQGEV